MNFRTNDNIDEAAGQESSGLKALSQLLVKAELQRIGLEKELQIAAREIVQLTVQDTVQTVLSEITGVKANSVLKARQSDTEAALNQAPAAIQEPVGAAPAAEIIKMRAHPSTPEPASTGLYIYGVASEKAGVDLGINGIAGCRVYALDAAGLCAVVHDCAAEPYRPDSDEQAKEWIFEHQDVLDQAKEKLNTILPFGFNTIIRATDRPPQEALQAWLSQERRRLLSLLERLKDNEEYAVIIMAPEEALKQEALREDNRLQTLQRELEGKPEGALYLYREKLEQAVKEALEDVVEINFRKIYKALRPLCTDIQVEKIKKAPSGMRAVASFSCLVRENRLPELGETLAKIQQQDGFNVDFSGPWPPYSFVGQLAMPT